MLFRMFANAVVGVCLSAAVAEARELKLGHTLSAASHYQAGATAMASELARLSGGALTIRIFPDGSLGGEREMVESVRADVIDLVITSTGPIGGFVPEIQIFDIPFLFRDIRHARAVFDGPIGQRALDALPKHNLIGLGWSENGFRNLTNNRKPIHSPADLQGLKIRTMENTIHIAAFRSVGVSPTPMAMPDLIAALQQGTVDGQENPIAVILAAKLSQVQKHLSLTQHVYSPALVLMAPGRWSGLSAQEQEWVAAAAKAAVAATRAASLAAAETGVEALRKQGMEVVTEIDRAAFIKALEPAYATFAKRFGQDKIDEIRNVP